MDYKNKLSAFINFKNIENLKQHYNIDYKNYVTKLNYTLSTPT